MCGKLKQNVNEKGEKRNGNITNQRSTRYHTYSILGVRYIHNGVALAYTFSRSFQVKYTDDAFTNNPALW